MNSPPPVRFPLGHTSQWGVVGTGMWLLALTAMLAALALHVPARSDTPAILIAVAASIAGMLLTLRLWRGQVSGELVWTGVEWFLEKNGTMTAIAHPGIRFDNQRRLLLYVRAGDRVIWLWIGRSAGPAHWHTLRCALYAQEVLTPLAPV
jgi:hypothetical protein